MPPPPQPLDDDKDGDNNDGNGCAQGMQINPPNHSGSNLFGVDKLKHSFGCCGIVGSMGSMTEGLKACRASSEAVRLFRSTEATCFV